MSEGWNAEGAANYATYASNLAMNALRAADDASRAAADAAGEALKQAEYAKAVGKEVGEYIKPASLEFEGGRYTNIPRYIESRRDARIFTVKIPKWAHSHDTACERADDAAGLSCEPSTNASQGRDDFAKYAAFMSKTCNGYVEDDGTPVVTAFEGDSGFRADGSNGDVWQMAPVLFWRWSETETHASLSVSDTWHAGFDPQPGAKRPTARCARSCCTRSTRSGRARTAGWRPCRARPCGTGP